MRACSVVGCEVSSISDAIFFEFPTSRALRRKWLDAIQITGKLTVDSSVCSGHFLKTDYEVVRGKVRLKRKVVPSIFQRDKVNISQQNHNNIEPNAVESRDICLENALRTAEEIPSQPEPPPLRVDEEIKDKEKLTSPCPNNILDRQSNINEITNNTSINKLEGVCLNRNNEGRSINTHTRSSQTNSFIPASVRKECARPNVTLDPDPRQDIEEMITNYHIKNKPNKLSPPLHGPETVEVLEEPRVVEATPVFIEVAVGQDGLPSEVSGASRDCLMVLESVQVDVDPSSLMLPEREEESEDDDVVEITKKEDPISLLTSSDEDEVIIEEPHIDTVEVSDEDEDDIPLGRLAKPRPGNPGEYPDIAKIMWGLYEYYCVKCKFNTTSRLDYDEHLKVHGTVLQMCQICGYTTSSKGQFTRHKRKHKDEKRFRCHLCSFRSRHQMSLVYHLKSHEGDERRFACGVCRYETRRRSDLNRHQIRLHGVDRFGNLF